MGNGASSEGRKKKKKKKERANQPFHPKRIYYDADGNLRHDWDRAPRNKKAELTMLMQAETAMEGGEEDIIDKPAEGGVVVTELKPPVPKLYYIASSAWVNAWLAFAFASKTSPDPGPCNNDTLLYNDHEKKCYVPNEGISLTRRTRKGDYRHVTEETWQQICKLYPGSGPTIKVYFTEDPQHISDGLYSTSGWDIDQSGYAEEIPNQKRKKDKKKETELNKAAAMEQKRKEEEEDLRSKTLSTDGIDMTMDDQYYKLDSRAEAMLGGSGISSSADPSKNQILYVNPMKRKKETASPAATSVPIGPTIDGSAPTDVGKKADCDKLPDSNAAKSPPTHEVHNEESEWLFR